MRSPQQEDGASSLPPLRAAHAYRDPKASLKEPSRPFTPGDAARRLLSSDHYAERPQSSAGPGGAAAFCAAGRGELRASRPGSASSSGGGGGGGAADVWTADSEQGPGSQPLGAPARRPSSSTGAGGARAAAAQLPPLSSPALPRSSSRLGGGLVRQAVITSCAPRPWSGGGEACGGAMQQGGSDERWAAAALSDVASAGSICSWASGSADDGAPTDQRPAQRPAKGVQQRPEEGQPQQQREAGAEAERCAVHRDQGGSERREWREGLERALHELSRAPLAAGPEHAVALLLRVSAVQALVDTAEARGLLGGWLDGQPGEASGSGGGRGGAAPAGGLRGAAVAALIRLADCPQPDVLLKAGSLLLRLLLRGGPQALQAARLLYRLSKDPANDARFRLGGLLRPILGSIAAHAADLAGAAGRGGCEAAAPCTLATSASGGGGVCGAGGGGVCGAGGGSSCGRGVLLYLSAAIKNVAAALRNLAVQPAHAALFLQPATGCSQPQQRPGSAAGGRPGAASGAAPRYRAPGGGGSCLSALLAAAAAFPGEGELLLNVSRCLSKLSTDASCLDALEAHTGALCALLRLTARHAASPPLLLRLAFVLGNAAARGAGARGALGGDAGGREALFGLLRRQADALQAAAPGEEAAGDAAAAVAAAARAEAEEACVKLLRLLACVAVHPPAGAALAAHAGCAALVARLLAGCRYPESGELALNAAAALGNLAYYTSEPSEESSTEGGSSGGGGGGFENKVLALDPAPLLRGLEPLLTSGDAPAAAEAAAALSNLLRGCAAARGALAGAPGGGGGGGAGAVVLQALVALLDHPCWEAAAGAAGALVNLAADAAGAAALQRAGGCDALAELVARCHTEEAEAAAQQCEDGDSGGGGGEELAAARRAAELAQRALHNASVLLE
ncbi:MAG: hypothetical protein J3K34DRAFT_499323 [Monoraphidium minutum]|nr:MAG: hypothetical protein J3K34DRAFT_499323 [Monoraphidium minutum]